MSKRNTLVGPQLQSGRTGFSPNWNRLGGFLAVIGAGVLVGLGTQMFFGRSGYSQAQAEALGWLCILGVWALLLLVLRVSFKVNPFLHGSARWADLRDIKAAGLMSGGGVYVGAWRDKRGIIHYLRHAGPEHVLCYAPTRTGKGVGLVVPTLLSWTQSAVVTDLKGELYELTAGWRRMYADNKIVRFEPSAADGSCCFNPMAELRLGTEHEVGDAQNLALLMVDPHGRGLRDSDHFQRTSYSLLVGCILHLCYKGKAEHTAANFAALDQMLADWSRPISELWAEMLTYRHVNGRNHPVVAGSARDMLDRPPAEAGSVLSTAKTYLDLYRDPVVARNTSRSDFRIRDLMHHESPVSLYIVTQPDDKERLRPLVRIVVNMIVRLLADKMEFENGRPKPAYKHKLLAMIDEFPSLGKLEIMEQSLAFVAGYGIKCYLISQDINQLKSREKGYGPDESITSNCHVQCAFPPNRLETAEHLSKLTGTTTIVKEAVTRSGRGLGVQVSTTMQEVQRPLLTPDECLRMPGPRKDAEGRITKAGDMVVYCAGFPAIYGRQPLYFEDPTFSARAAIQPPKRSDIL
jgi:type IV secretion system protein VirD4